MKNHTHNLKTPAGHIRLDVRQFVGQRTIPKEHVTNMTNSELIAEIKDETGDLVIQNILRVPGKEFDSKVVSYGTTWWDAWKIAHPRLAKLFRMERPRVTVASITANSFYPSLRVPNHKAFVQVTLGKRTGTLDDY